jgi:hypothetical protein
MARAAISPDKGSFTVSVEERFTTTGSLQFKAPTPESYKTQKGSGSGSPSSPSRNAPSSSPSSSSSPGGARRAPYAAIDAPSFGLASDAVHHRQWNAAQYTEPHAHGLKTLEPAKVVGAKYDSVVLGDPEPNDPLRYVSATAFAAQAGLVPAGATVSLASTSSSSSPSKAHVPVVKPRYVTDHPALDVAAHQEAELEAAASRDAEDSEGAAAAARTGMASWYGIPTKTERAHEAAKEVAREQNARLEAKLERTQSPLKRAAAMVAGSPTA